MRLAGKEWRIRTDPARVASPPRAHAALLAAPRESESHRSHDWFLKRKASVPLSGTYNFVWSDGMIKLFSVKEKQKKEAAAPGAKGVKQSAGELRLQKDISELNLAKGTTINFPEGKDKLLKFEITIRPEEGIYRTGAFVFSFDISTAYPHDAPKVKCKTKVFHPNIDLDGNVCLNILREDWKPVLSINSVIYGLQFLFMDPNPEDPLNKEAAEMFTSQRRTFETHVASSIYRGGHICGTYFPPCRA